MHETIREASGAYAAEIRANGRVLAAVTAGMGAGYLLNHYIANSFAPNLIAEFGWSRPDFALVGALGLLSLFVVPVVGRMTDVFGSRRAMASAGVAPRVMGVGPIEAARRLFARTGLTMADIDVIELNEAFASQAIASLRALGVDPADRRVNPNGGAIALGHPLGMSGARLVMTAVEELQRTGGHRALAFLCVGVGQGIGMILERV